MNVTSNLRVLNLLPLVSPAELKRELPLSRAAARTVSAARRDIEAALSGRDPRLLVIAGPCSIHDPEAALEYAQRLLELRERHADALLICMRVYFEKPRTTVGWKGLVNDPRLDGSCDVAAGLRVARKLLLEISEMGVPCATEMLDPVAPQYVADLISWVAIGARTTESQTHREMASGLSMPVGFKNGTDGGVEVALHAIQAARESHSFIGINDDGQVAVVTTAGNSQGYLVLRGGRSGTNYDEHAVGLAATRLEAAGLPARIIIDCSHDNSGQNASRQQHALRDVARQVASGSRAIAGVMLESNLVAGAQRPARLPELVYGQSITDACIDIEATAPLLAELAQASSSLPRRARRVRADRFSSASSA